MLLHDVLIAFQVKQNNGNAAAIQTATQDNVKAHEGFVEAARLKAHEDPAGVDVAKIFAEISRLENDLATEFESLSTSLSADFLNAAEYANDMKKARHSLFRLRLIVRWSRLRAPSWAAQPRCRHWKSNCVMLRRLCLMLRHRNAKSMVGIILLRCISYLASFLCRSTTSPWRSTTAATPRVRWHPTSTSHARNDDAGT